MARPKEKVTVMTKQGKRTYQLDKKTGKKKTGRPSIFTPELINKLEELFSWDCSIRTACAVAGISETAYYAECERNKEFKEKMDRAQQYVSSLASRTIAKSIRDGDAQTSKRYMEHRDERYKKENKVGIAVNTDADPETGLVSTGLEVEFELTD